MRKTLALLPLLIFLAWLIVINCPAQYKRLQGIDCKLRPTATADVFQKPVKSVSGKAWTVTNGFGNVVTNADVAGLPGGYWQHTGLDYLLGGKSSESQNQLVYAAANGVVAFPPSRHLTSIRCPAEAGW